MKPEERREEILRKARTQAFLEKFQNKRTFIPAGGVSLFLGSPGKNEVDKRDGVLAMKRENEDIVNPWIQGSKKKQELYEARDRIDHLALYNYFKDNDTAEEMARAALDPEEIKGPFRRKFFSNREFDVKSQLSKAE